MQDAEIIARIRSGETDAWRLLFDKYRGGLLRVGTGLGLSDADAEEIENDVFLSAFTLLREGKLGANVGPWLRTVMRNRAVDRYRQNKRELESEPQYGTDDQHGGSTTPKEIRRRFKRAWQQFAKSNPRSESPGTEANDTDILHWIANHATNEDLADYLTIDPNAARQRKLRALRRLKQKMDGLAQSSGCAVLNDGK